MMKYDNDRICLKYKDAFAYKEVVIAVFSRRMEAYMVNSIRF